NSRRNPSEQDDLQEWAEPGLNRRPSDFQSRDFSASTTTKTAHFPADSRSKQTPGEVPFLSRLYQNSVPFPSIPYRIPYQAASVYPVGTLATSALLRMPGNG